ncbi:SDR family NAD(P)-dependent oxidoreductase [Thermodesulfobacteriota bacterium]
MISSLADLSGKVALVTGGTRGIGASIADTFAQANADVIITGTGLESVNGRVEELREKGSGSPQGWVADFTDANVLSEICDRIRALDRLDILINNAGINHILPIDEINAPDLERLMALNLNAPTLLSGAAATIMKQRQWGRIVNIASIWSVITKPGRAMYSASKFGLVGLTKTTAVDLGPYNILVNALSPGFTLTDLTNATLPAAEQKQIADQVPMRRFAQPEEMARVVLFLCSELNTYLTGQNVVVDGGFVNV